MRSRLKSSADASKLAMAAVGPSLLGLGFRVSSTVSSIWLLLLNEIWQPQPLQRVLQRVI